MAIGSNAIHPNLAAVQGQNSSIIKISREEILSILTEMNSVIADIKSELNILANYEATIIQSLSKNNFFSNFRNKNKNYEEILVEKNQIDLLLSTLSTLITNTLNIVNGEDPKNFNPNAFQSFILQIVGQVNEVSKKIRKNNVEITGSYEAMVLFQDSSNKILEIYNLINKSSIEPGFKIEYLKKIWENLWTTKITDAISLRALVVVNDFYVNFYIEFLENISNKGNLFTLEMKKKVLDYDPKYGEFYLDPLTLTPKLGDDRLNILEQKLGKDIIDLYNKQISTQTNTQAVASNQLNNNNSKPSASNISQNQISSGYGQPLNYTSSDYKITSNSQSIKTTSSIPNEEILNKFKAKALELENILEQIEISVNKNVQIDIQLFGICDKLESELEELYQILFSQTNNFIMNKYTMKQVYEINFNYNSEFKVGFKYFMTEINGSYDNKKMISYLGALRQYLIYFSKI